jgi:hypothetical protein
MPQHKIGIVSPVSLMTALVACMSMGSAGDSSRLRASEAATPEEKIAASWDPPRASLARGSSSVVQEAYGQLPIAFEPNQGQTDRGVDFMARGRGYALFLSPQEAVLRLTSGRVGDPGAALMPAAAHEAVGRTESPGHATLRVRLAGGNAAARASVADELPGKISYFTARSPALWRTNIPTFGRVTYRGVYPGVDLLYYGTQQHLEYDFVVHPNGDPASIKLSFSGANGVRLDASGDLVLQTSAGVVRHRKPRVYQDLNGMRQPVDGRYRLIARDEVGFEVGAYDRTRPLVIDPVLVYSTFLGGSQSDEGWGIAVDSTGAVYVVGNTFSADFPAGAGALDATLSGGGTDVFVTKLNPSGSAVVYSTYLGGSDFDEGQSIAVNASGAAYVAGGTSSTDFPVTSGAFDSSFNGVVDAFVTKLRPDGQALEYSTYVGGSGDDRGRGVALDASGNGYITGITVSADFPTTAGAFGTASQGAEDAFVTKINPTGSALVYSALLGGNSSDYGFGIAVDAGGSAYVTGRTLSNTFPTTVGGLDTTFGGSADAFVAKVDPLGAALSYSTFLGGGAFDQGFRIAVDSLGAAYVVGLTLSNDFPTTPGAFDRIYGGGSGDVFVAKLNGGGSALGFSTFLGGSGLDFAGGIAVDTMGYTYVAGVTASSDFPTTANAPDTSANGGNDVFVTKLTPNGGALVYSTYLGGTGQDESRALAIDTIGAAYVTGITASPAFPTTVGVFDTTFNDTSGGPDAFVVKLGEPPDPGPIVRDQSFDPEDFLGIGVDGVGYSIGGGLSQYLAQTFTVGVSGRLTRVDVKIGGFGGPTQPISVDVRRTTATRPIENNADVLASAVIPASSVPQSPNAARFVTVDLSSTPVTVSAGDVLAIVLWSAEQIGSYGWQAASTGNPPASPLYPRGAQFFRNTNNPTWGNPIISDMGFRTFVDTSAQPHDQTAPVLALPGPFSVAATSAAGAALTFTASATDDTDLTPEVTCTPVSGSTFPLGLTSVTCTATDASGNSSQGTFTVTVFDHVAPVLSSLPSDLVLEAAGPTGAVATWPSPSATDAINGALPVTCSPQSGSTFALGLTTVTCGASDGSGNPATATFTIRVRDTLAPQVVTSSPDRDALIATSPTTVTMQASDLVGVTGVTVNGLAAVLTAGSAQSGTWQAQVPVNVAGVALTFTALAQDGSTNTASASLTVDNDGIAAVIDRTIAGLVDRSSVYSLEFTDGVTSGTIYRSAVTTQVTANKVASGAVRLAVLGGSSLFADIYPCSGWTKYIRLNGGEAVDVTCTAAGTVTVRVVTASPSVEVYKLTTGTYYESYTYCSTQYYTCGFGRTCSYTSCSTTTYPVTHSYWYWTSLTSGQAVSTGSPVTAALDNTGPLDVSILRIQEDGTAIPIGSLDLDPGESADVGVTQNTNGPDLLEIFALIGDIKATIGGQTRTIGQGQHEVLATDLIPPVIASVSDLTVDTSSASGAIVNYTLPPASDNMDPSPVVSGNPAPGSLFPLGETLVTVTAVDAAGNGSATTFKIFVRLPPPPGYGFQGFFAPVDNPPTANRMKAGAAVPVKFSLTGNFGLNIFQTGYPASQPMSCQGAVLDDVEQTVAAGSSTLNYDAATDQYNYVWKTDKSWAGTCRQLVLKLGDGTVKTALFTFTK